MSVLGEEPEAKEAEPEDDAYPDDPFVAGVARHGDLVDCGNTDERRDNSADVHKVPTRELDFDHPLSYKVPLSAEFNLPDTVKAALDPSIGMRRKEKEITERTVMEELLREQEVGRLATSVDDQPYIVPINYVYNDGKIIFHSHKDGTKMANIAKNPRVCFEVDSGEIVRAEKPCDYSWRYMSVIVKGNVKIITDPAARLVALRRISDKYAPGKGKTLTADELAKNPQLVLAEIVIEEMTGKKSPVKPLA